MISKATMEKINEVNDLLIKAKHLLIEAENQAVDIREKTGIEVVSVHIQAGIKEILRTFYPKGEFSAIEWLKRRTVKDVEHDTKVQKILDDSAQRQVINEEANQSETCPHDCKDCDSREVVGDEEHCGQEEEMR